VQQHAYGVRYWDGSGPSGRWLYLGMEFVEGTGHTDHWWPDEGKVYTSTSLLSTQFKAQKWAHQLKRVVQVVVFLNPMEVWTTHHSHRLLELGLFPIADDCSPGEAAGLRATNERIQAAQGQTPEQLATQHLRAVALEELACLQIKSVAALSKAASRNDLTVGDLLCVWKEANQLQQQVQPKVEQAVVDQVIQALATKAGDGLSLNTDFERVLRNRPFDRPRAHIQPDTELAALRQRAEAELKRRQKAGGWQATVAAIRRKDAQTLARTQLKPVSPPSGVSVIVTCANKYLVSQRIAADDQHFKGCWQFPGGKVAVGETVEQAAIRELKEETGLVTTSITLHELGFDKYVKPYVYDCTKFVTFVDSWRVPVNPEPDKHTGWRWVTYNQLKKLKLMPDSMKYVASVRAM